MSPPQRSNRRSDWASAEPDAGLGNSDRGGARGICRLVAGKFAARRGLHIVPHALVFNSALDLP
jgi:hypothetical protein